MTRFKLIMAHSHRLARRMGTKRRLMRLTLRGIGLIAFYQQG